ncbi:transmembrane protein 79 [Cheilinus undulatus]|uniref:transmembrane protein 79 n=1 Tax=Cheilinus undulatus TaxID=241271 RepID=UPI001BD5033B|nr:transmembrane protein 79 [Cheilinus undulatus]XP_041664342.1 transmembrane protein 79 [Cheilinus undulatus]XP_041664343.1 transmembrane protein 79 [Cheilinus undulatus]
MSGQGGFSSDLPEEVTFLAVDPQTLVGKKPQENDSNGEKREIIDEEGEDLKHDEHEEEDMTSSALLEPSTLPWPGDRDERPQMDNDEDDGETGSEKRVSEPDERDTGISGGSQDLSEEQSQAESDRKSKSKWRESMPEGERWRDDEIEVRRDDKGDGSLADDEHEEEEEEEDDMNWMPEKSALGFTPHVTIVRPSSKELPEESQLFIERDNGNEPQMETEPVMQFQPEWTEEDDKYYLCEHLCSEKLRLALATTAAAILFPLLVWGGYALLPFDPPVLSNPPLRVMYTLRCAFFATIPILLGVVVQGIARLRFSSLRPLYQSKLVNKEVAVHWHYVNESLTLFLFYFLQLAVMASYISQDLVKLVPLLTIIFVFGRLIYWLCLSLGSTIRGLGFGFSFIPILVMLGANLYYICSSVGQGAVFDVASPTTAPPPRQRWWG